MFSISASLPSHSLIHVPALLRSEKQGFDASKLGMSQSEASDLALKFATYDINDDSR
jgi:hypothetical protein